MLIYCLFFLLVNVRDRHAHGTLIIVLLIYFGFSAKYMLLRGLILPLV